MIRGGTDVTGHRARRPAVAARERARGDARGAVPARPSFERRSTGSRDGDRPPRVAARCAVPTAAARAAAAGSALAMANISKELAEGRSRLRARLEV